MMQARLQLYALLRAGLQSKTRKGTVKLSDDPVDAVNHERTHTSNHDDKPMLRKL